MIRDVDLAVKGGARRMGDFSKRCSNRSRTSALKERVLPSVVYLAIRLLPAVYAVPAFRNCTVFQDFIMGIAGSSDTCMIRQNSDLCADR